MGRLRIELEDRDYMDPLRIFSRKEFRRRGLGAQCFGPGRRLRGPEQDTEDDSVFEEPEILEGERPRPQGSSPVEEFPAEKQVEEDLYDSPHKIVGSKKTRRVGFGSLFDKRSTAKMSEDIQSGESGVIMKTVKEACAEGLVLTGGGKEGIFIKEVKPDSPASKHLNMKEGDQILSATVYFDNVSYEDALQILEHAQPYKMEICLRRKADSTMPEDADILHPEGNEESSPEMRIQRKMKKQQDRISWPKFPSFGKGRRAQFKRSHSTSEAEEHRKLEMSPPTSDTESPFKSPLKFPDEKEQKRKQKMQLNVKTKGYRSKSVEEPQRKEKELITEKMAVCENQQVDIVEEKLPEEVTTKLEDTAHVTDEVESEISSKIKQDHALSSLSEMELQHKVHYISLGSTLKTTDIAVNFAEGSAGIMRTLEEGKVERSEMKVNIHQKEKTDTGIGNQSGENRISDICASDNDGVSPVVISQAESERFQLNPDLNTQAAIKGSSEEVSIVSINTKMTIPKLDDSLELSSVGELKKSQRTGSEKESKERNIFENESYGIRIRGPLADMATTKPHFASAMNGFQFLLTESSDKKQESTITDTQEAGFAIPDISQAKSKTDTSVSALDMKDLEIKKSKLPTLTNTDHLIADVDKKSESKFKLPNVDLSKFATQDPIKITKNEQMKTSLPNREDIEIPGIEGKPCLQTPAIKVPKIEKITKITKEAKIQAHQTVEGFSVEDVKEAVSKFPAFKLPEGDVTGVLVQREVTIMEMKGDKSNITPRGSPRKISVTSADSSTTLTKSQMGKEKSSESEIADKDLGTKIPKVELHYDAEQTSVAIKKTDYTKTKIPKPNTDTTLITDDEKLGEVTFKLPKREDIEIPGMEAIKKSNIQKTKIKADKDAQTAVQPGEKPKTKKYGIQKGQEKKSKKAKIAMPSFGITKPDIRFPDIGTDFPKTEVHKNDAGEIKIKKFEVDILQIDTNLKDVSLPEDKDLKLHTMEHISSKSYTKFGNKEADIPIHEQFGMGKSLPDKKGPDLDKEAQLDNVVEKTQNIEMAGQGSKFKLPKFEISFPEVKVPKMHFSHAFSPKDTEISIAEGNTDMPATYAADVEMPDAKAKIKDVPEEYCKDQEMKTKHSSFSFPKFGFSKSDTKITEADVSLKNAEGSLPERNVDVEVENTEITFSVGDRRQEDETKFGSPTKFKIPSISLPKFGAKASKVAVDISEVESQVTAPETGLKQEGTVSDEPLSLNIKGPDVDKKGKALKDIQIEGQESKFRLPKFDIGFREVKGPQINLHAGKTETDISAQEGKGEVPESDVEMTCLKTVKSDIKKVDSKGQDIEIKKPVFSFPRFSFSKSETQDAETDVSLPQVDVSLPDEDVKIEEQDANIKFAMACTGEEDTRKVGSATKFKLPTISLPKFGAKAPKAAVDISGVDVQMKGSEISVPQTEVIVSSEPLSVDIKAPGIDKEAKSQTADIKAEEMKIEGQESKFKLPKFGISFPDIKGPKIDLHGSKTTTEISLPGGKGELHAPDVEVPDVKSEVKLDLPKVDSQGLQVEMKKSGFTLPKIGLSKSGTKLPETDVSLPQVDVSLPEVKIEGPDADIKLAMQDTGEEDKMKVGSATKFKMPTISLPKFGAKAPKVEVDISGEDAQMKDSEISLSETNVVVSGEPLSVDVKAPEVGKEAKSLNVDIKAEGLQIEGQESKFKLPNFGISFPEVKGPKIDLHGSKTTTDISLTEGKGEVHAHDLEVPEVKTEVKVDLPKGDSKALKVELKKPGVSLPKIGLSKSGTKAPETDVSLPQVDVSLPGEDIKIEGPDADIKLAMCDTGEEDKMKVGSATKFKMPTISLPKFGAKAPKAAVDISGEDAQIKDSEISLPETNVVALSEPLSLNIKAPEIDKEAKSLNVDVKAEDMKIEGQESKFKLPKFGISFPEVKGPKIDLHGSKTTTEISLPGGKGELHVPDVEVPDVKSEVKLDLPKVDSQGLQVEMKKSGFTLPKIGLSKSGTKLPETDVSLPQVDVSLPGEVKIEGPDAEIKLALCDTGEEDKMKVGSATKFKMPTISLPKFGAKAPKVTVDISGEDAQMKGPEISLSETKVVVSGEPLSVDVKAPEVDKEAKSLNVDVKEEDMKIEGQESKFKLPKFGISFPEIKGPKIDLHGSKTTTDVSLPEGKGELHAPDVEVPDVKSEVKLDLPKGDSKGLKVEIKKPSVSLPTTGFSKSREASDTDVSLTQFDVSLPGEHVKIEGPDSNIKFAMGSTGEEDKMRAGSTTKFTLPTISLPKFGAKAPKAVVGISGEDVQVKGPETSLPQTEIVVSGEPLSVDVKAPEVDKEAKSLNVDVKEEDMKIEGQESKFKLPKFGISFPEVKGPKIDLHGSKTTTDVSLPEGKGELHAPDVEVPDVKSEVKLDLPKGDSKGLKVEIKKPSVSLPTTGFSKSREASDTDVSLTQFDVSLPGEHVKIEGPDSNIKFAMGSTGEEDKMRAGSTTKFTLPTISLPKFGAKAPKAVVGISGEDVQVKGPETSLPQTEIVVSSQRMSLDIKAPDIDKEAKSLNVNIKAEELKIEGQESKFKLPKFGISFPEVKGPKIDLHGSKTTTDISLPEGKGEVHAPDLKVPEVKTEVKLDLPKGDSKALKVELKTPGVSLPTTGFSKSTEASDTDVSLPEFDVSLPGEHVKIEGPDSNIKLAMGYTGEEDKMKAGSTTKFTLPTISLPKFGAKAPKEVVGISGVDVQVKGPETSLPQTEIVVSSQPMSLDIKAPDMDKEAKSLNVNIKAEELKIEGQESKFKLPKFGISFPEVKGPKIDLHGSKTKTDISLPEGKGEVHAPDVEVPDVKTEVKLDLPKGDSEGLKLEMKNPGVSLPTIGFSKVVAKASDADVTLPQVNVSLPGEDVKAEGPDANVKLAMDDTAEDKMKVGSATKFKLPTISFPKFGSKAKKESVDMSGVDVQIKGPEISLRQTEVVVSSEPMSLNIKAPDIDKEAKSQTADIKAEDMKIEGQENKFKLPKFGISFPDIKGPKIDLHGSKTTTDISLPDGKGELHAPDVEMPDVKTEVKLDLPKGESHGLQVEMKESGFSLPKIGLSKSETKAPETDVSLPQVDVSLPGQDVKVEGPEANVNLAMGDTREQDKLKFGSPTKFKLPTISFPKFGSKAKKESVDISGVDVQMKGPEISLPQTEVVVSSEPMSLNIKAPDIDKEAKSQTADIKAEDMKIEGQESKFKLPKFGISFPDIKEPKIDLHGSKTTTDVSLPEGKGELHVPDVEMPDVKTEVKLDLPKGESQGLQVEIKESGFSLPKIGLSKSDTKAPETDVSLPQVDVSLPGQDVKVEGPEANVNLAMGDTGEQDKLKFGSPTKFKLPTISFPKFGSKAKKESVDMSGVDVQMKGPEISLPQTEVVVSSEPMSLNIKAPDIDKEAKSQTADIKAEDMKIEGHESKFKLPKFGISFPDIKGPKIDLHGSKTTTDVSLPEGKGELHVPDVEMPDVKTEVKLDLPKGESQGLQVEIKESGFSLPKIGLSKSDTKAPETDVSLPQVDVSLPGQDVKLEGPEANVNLAMGDTREQDKLKFGSPTKFKLPTISFPKFGSKAKKESVDISGVDVQMKGPEISLPQTEVVVSSEPMSLNIKAPDIDKEAKSQTADIKAEDMKILGQESKFKLPKFGISFPDIKGPKIDLHGSKTTTDVSLPEGKGELHVPDVEMPDVKTEVKLDLPKGESQGLQVEMKKSGFSLPKIGLSKSETKVPETDVSLPQVDVSLPGQDVKVEGPEANVNLAMGDTREQDKLKFGSPTKFKLPTISFPKFGSKAKKESVDISGVDVQMKGPEIRLPQTEVVVSSEPMSLNIKAPDLDKEAKFQTADIKAEDMKIEGQESQFKLPKFGISFPDIKGPKIDLHGSKTTTHMSLPDGKGELHVPDVEMPDVKTEVKLDLPKGESKGLQVEMKKPGVSLSPIELSKSATKASDADVSLPQLDVSLPVEDAKIEGPDSNIKLAMGYTGEEDKMKAGSTTKFTLPTISLPKFGAKAPKEVVGISGVDVQMKGPKISLPKTEVVVSSQPLSLDIKAPDKHEDAKSLNVDIKAEDMKIDGQESKFKLPKFGISFPDVKGPTIDLHGSKTTTDISLPEGKGEVHGPDVEIPDVQTEVKLDLPKGDSKGLKVEIKKPGVSLPTTGHSKSATEASASDVSLPQVDVSLQGVDVKLEGPDADINLAMGDTGEQDKLQFGSPTKFKLPTISLPKFGSKAKKEAADISGVDVQMKGPERSLPQTEVVVSSQPLSLDIKAPDKHKDAKSLNVIKAEDMKIDGQESKFKLPKFGISFPEVKGPKIDLLAGKTQTDISLPEVKAEVHVSDGEMKDVKTEEKGNLPEVDSKGPEVKAKKTGFSFPWFGFSKSETKAPKADITLPQGDVSLTKENVKIEETNTDVSIGDTGQEDKMKFGSPTKFKLPSISLPKFGAKSTKESVDISAVDEQIQRSEIHLPEVEMRVPAEPLSVDIKWPERDKDGTSFSVQTKAQDIQTEEKEKKSQLPKFGISIPEVKGPKIDMHASKTKSDISLPEGKGEVHASDLEIPNIKTEVEVNLPEVDSKGIEIKMKKSSFSFPKFGFSKPETKAPEADVSIPPVDISLPDESGKMEGPNTDLALSIDDTRQTDETKFGSPTKFKLPLISLPKFGAKLPKGSVDISAVDDQTKGPEISLPEREAQKSTEPLSVDIKKAELDKEGTCVHVEMKGQDNKIDGQESISLSGRKGEVHAPNVEMPDLKIELKENLPEVDSKGLEVKMKRPGFSISRFGSSKAETKAPEPYSRLLHVDPLSGQNIQIEQTDITLSMGDTAQKGETKVDSPKFKLPSISFPKFRTKTSKAALDISAVHVEVTRPEISPPEAELKVSSKLLSVDPKGPGVDKEGKMDIADINTGINSSSDHIKCQDSKTEGKDKVQQSSEAAVKHEEGSPSRFKPPTMKMPIISVSKSQFHDGQDDAVMSAAPEPKHKEITQGQEKSSKFTIPKFADVLRGFDVEFNVPKLDEIEQTKKETSTPTKQEHVTGVKGEDSTEGITANKEEGAHEKSMLKFRFPKLRFSQPSDDGDNMENSEAVLENKLSSPTNTAKVNEQEDSQSPRKAIGCPGSDIKAKGAEKSSTVEVEEDTVSATLSLRSSEAFADISAPTTEQAGLSLASPTKIKVKYSEPAIEVSDLHGDVITSTTSTELIFMEPHQPEKVNIPFSDESSSSSLNTLKQMSGEVHIITSNVQTVPDTQHATILTYLDSQVIQTLPSEEMTIKSDSVLSVETHRVLKEEHTLVEKHVVEEMLGDEKILVTSRTQVFEGGVADADTASSIKKLKDIVHTEKMRFFEGADSSEKIIMSSETSLRHADSSTDENEGK